MQCCVISNGIQCVKQIRFGEAGHEGDHVFKIKEKEKETDKITVSMALPMLRKWECLGYPFPRTSEGLTGLAEAFVAIVGTVANAKWMVDYVLKGCPRCPVPAEIRKIMDFNRGLPADGVTFAMQDASKYMLNTSRED